MPLSMTVPVLKSRPLESPSPPIMLIVELQLFAIWPPGLLDSEPLPSPAAPLKCHEAIVCDGCDVSRGSYQ